MSLREDFVERVYKSMPGGVDRKDLSRELRALDVIERIAKALGYRVNIVRLPAVKRPSRGKK